MADRREELRAADVDRQFVAERLKAALDEGRLSLGEYDERLQETYSSRTYGDLDKVLSDLPGFVPMGDSQLMPSRQAAAASGVGEPGPADSAIPKWLIGIWSAWLIAVSVNVVIWLLVSLSAGHLIYFWPMWVAGPWGAVLLATSLSTLLSGGSDESKDGIDGLKRRRDRRRDRRHDRRGFDY